jgi:uncharacterized DUF497 family protein
VDYEWDETKAQTNRRDHGIDFADAATVFEDDFALTALDDASVEDRFVTLGMDAVGRLLVVVYTWRGDRIRIISARKATKPERRHYEMDR